MAERIAQKPLYLAMENASVASTILQMIRRYPNLETLRVAKPPGKLSVFMVEREPSVIVVDAQIAPALVTKAKSRVPFLNVIVVAPRHEIDNTPIDPKLRTQFLAEDCNQRELHSLLDSLLSESRNVTEGSIVADMAALFSVGDHRGTLDVRNLETGEQGKISFSHSTMVGSQVGDVDGPDALETMKSWNACDFKWTDVLEGFDDNFLEEVSLSLLAEASELVADERGLVEATDTSMFPMSFDSDVELEDVKQTPDFFPSNITHPRRAAKRATRSVTGPLQFDLNSDSPEVSGLQEPQHKHAVKKLAATTEATHSVKAPEKTDETTSSHQAAPTSYQPGNGDVSTSPAADFQPNDPKQNNLIIGALMASNASEILQELTTIAGFIAGAVVDSDSGMTLAKLSNSMGFDIDVAAATNTEVIKAKLRAAKALKLDDNIEDILITLTNQYHILRPLEEYPSIFFYIALDREQANLAMARIKLKTVGAKIKL